MFPTANSTIYRNKAGEPIGWDSSAYDEPDYDPFYDDYDEGEEE